MKPHFTLLALLFTAPLARAILTIPSDGSDGIFAPATSVEIDLSQATTGAWDASNAATPGKGRYDATKWAIVFKYNTVSIPAGVTVTFKNHPSHAPVVWLVQNHVAISGTVDLRGKVGTHDSILGLAPVEPGPGGFRGAGFGPSGYGFGHGLGGGGVSGHFAYASEGSYAGVYGNPQIIPLIGGSGSGAHSNSPESGSGGGGAILIGAGKNVLIDGEINVLGGRADRTIGSGGAVRIIAERVFGSGSVIAVQAGPGLDPVPHPGRIRVETPDISGAINFFPSTVAVPPANPPIIWPAANAPTVKIASIDGIAAPADPTAPLLNTSDVALEKNTAVDVIIQTTNFPTSGVVQVRDVKKYGNATWTNATLVPGGTFTTATWKATLTFSGGFTTLQAKATVP